MKKISLGMVDDHKLFLHSLAAMLANFNEFDILVEAANGKDLQEKLRSKKQLPDIMLIDVNMPVMDGIATAKWLNEEYPAIKLVALTMNDNDKTIIDMLRAGCCAYMLKDTAPEELCRALQEIHTKGYFNGDHANINFRRLLLAEKEHQELKLSEPEMSFLKLICSDLTYKQIAAQLHMSERNAESYRNNLFQKFNVQSRVGLAMEAIKKGIIKVDDL